MPRRPFALAALGLALNAAAPAHMEANHVAKMKWLGANCGDVKPLSAMQPRPAKP